MPRSTAASFHPEVEGVLHGHVHALTGLRAVGVTRVAGDEDPREAGSHLLLGYVVELVAEALADLVNGAPGDVRDPVAIGIGGSTIYLLINNGVVTAQ